MTLWGNRDKVSKGQRKLEDSGGGLLPAVERHSLEYNRIVVVIFRSGNRVLFPTLGSSVHNVRH